MKIDMEVVRHLEKLARIDLSSDEREILIEQLGRIVGYVERLSEADTEEVSPTSAVVHEKEAVLRSDEIRQGLDRDVVLDMAPDAKGVYFRVPRIIER